MNNNASLTTFADLDKDVQKALINIFKYCVQDPSSEINIRNEISCSLLIGKKCSGRYILYPIEFQLTKMYNRFLKNLGISTLENFILRFKKTNTLERLYCYYLIAEFYRIHDSDVVNRWPLHYEPDLLYMLKVSITSDSIIFSKMKKIPSIECVITAIEKKKNEPNKKNTEFIPLSLNKDKVYPGVDSDTNSITQSNEPQSNEPQSDEPFSKGGKLQNSRKKPSKTLRKRKQTLRKSSYRKHT